MVMRDGLHISIHSGPRSSQIVWSVAYPQGLFPFSLILSAHEEDRSFADPTLPPCAPGSPQAGSAQVGNLKPRSCIQTSTQELV